MVASDALFCPGNVIKVYLHWPFLPVHASIIWLSHDPTPVNIFIQSSFSSFIAVISLFDSARCEVDFINFPYNFAQVTFLLLHFSSPFISCHFLVRFSQMQTVFQDFLHIILLRLPFFFFLLSFILLINKLKFPGSIQPGMKGILGFFSVCKLIEIRNVLKGFTWSKQIDLARCKVDLIIFSPFPRELEIKNAFTMFYEVKVVPQFNPAQLNSSDYSNSIPFYYC